MKIKFYKGVGDVAFTIEANEDECCSADALRALADKFQSEMSHAHEAAYLVWERFPEFRQVTFDTLTDEERSAMAVTQNTKVSN